MIVHKYRIIGCPVALYTVTRPRGAALLTDKDQTVSTEYASKHKPASVKPARRVWGKKKVTFVAVVGAVLVVPVAAWAAVQIFGFGDFSVAGAETNDLSVDNVQTVQPLTPGSSVDVKAIVHNPNKYPVTVTNAIIRAEGLTATGGGNCASAGIMTPGGTYNANYGDRIGAGWKSNVEPVRVPAGGAAWVTVQNAVAMSADANRMCGFAGHVAVLANAGN